MDRPALDLEINYCTPCLKLNFGGNCQKSGMIDPLFRNPFKLNFNTKNGATLKFGFFKVISILKLPRDKSSADISNPIYFGGLFKNN